MTDTSTSSLERVLERATPADIDPYLETYADDLVREKHPFGDYMRVLLKQRGITQQQLFLRAGLSDRYGYRLLTQEKNTRQRDYILRLCLAAELSLTEAQRALKLYGMSELYAKVPRDAVLMIAFNRKIYDMAEVNALLDSHGMAPLRASSDVK